ncbi:hypothetical protein PVAND_005880 [Polypedilum vanderplanki]|uniref:Piezo non-specific cation channel R-Ras-binding domain-containing protein n=1 Tax=Polypedilum vanderplanki TaxID=319348 RepID=A0A9J6C1F7_POLVA|nr:hypothetical protein PVAND_005880 [Polypedilum vanderplanki]
MITISFCCLIGFLNFIICTSIIFKPLSFSTIFLIFVFVSPYFNSNDTLKKFGFNSLLTLSIANLILQVLYQLINLFPINDKISNVLETIGFLNFSTSSFIDIGLAIIPELTILLCTFIVKKFEKKQDKTTDQSECVILKRFGIALSISSLCISGIIMPSAFNVIFYISFLIYITLLGCNQKLGRKFAFSLKILSILIVVQMLALVVYQLNFSKAIISSNSNEAKFFGMHIIQQFSNHTNMSFDRLMYEFKCFLHPIVLTSTYFIITCTSIFFSQYSKIKLNEDEEWQIDEEESKILDIETNINEKSVFSFKSMFQERKSSIYIKISCKKFVMSAFNYMYDNSFIITILSMMIWSILFHSWLGFIFLLTSNIIFVLSNKRRKIIRFSSLIIVYALFLIAINYVFGIDFDYMQTVKRNFQDIALTDYEKKYPIFSLLIKSILVVPFFITLRQKFIEKDSNDANKSKGLNDNKSSSKFHTMMSNTLKKSLIFVWMWVIAFILFILALYGDNDMTLSRLINMGFFLTYVLLFQLSYTLWKNTMYIFWMMLISYAQIYLTLIYVYQFEDIPKLPDALGIRKYDTTELFLKLFSFTLITILTGIQLNYFHKRLQKYLSESSGDPKSKISHFKKNETFHTLEIIVKQFLVFLNIHSFELYFIISFWITSKNLQIINVLIMILLAIGTISKLQKIKLLIIKIITIISMSYIFGIVLIDFTMPYIRYTFLYKRIETNCYETIENRDITAVTFEFKSFGDWFKVGDHEANVGKIETQMTLVILSTFLFALKYYQTLTRKEKHGHLVFNVTKENSEKSLKNFFKYLIDNGFAIYGIELTLFVFAIVISIRTDLVSLFYIPFFVLLIFKNRCELKNYWIVFAHILTISIILQCIALGFSTIMKPCYINKRNFELDLGTNIISRIFYNNLAYLNSASYIMIYDFLLLVIMCSQIPFCYDESTNENQCESSHQVKTFKKYLCKSHLWITLLIIFIISTYKVDLFSLGYVTISFAFLWQGTDFYLKSIKDIIKWWNFILIFNILDLILKVITQVIGCFFGKEIITELCKFLKLLEIPCFIELNHTCKNTKYELNDLFHILIFLLILIQKRVFLCDYFKNIVFDTYATILLSSRGAEIIECIRTNEVKDAVLLEKQTFYAIKKKMEVIKRIGERNKISKVLNHDLAIRSGDYYMFKEDLIDDLKHPSDASLFIHSTANLSRSSDMTSYEEDIISEKSKEKIQKERNKTIKEIALFSLQKILIKLHQASKKYLLITLNLDEEIKKLKAAVETHSSIEIVKKKMLEIQNDFEISKNHSDNCSDLEKASVFYKEFGEPPLTFYGFMNVLFLFIISHTDLLVFLMIFINHVMSANVLSLVLPLLLFIWGTLTFPRPSNIFWILVIAYTQIVILLKCLTKFTALWCNKNDSLCQLIGFNMEKYFVTFDLLLLLALFIHRAVLKKFGVWKSQDQFEFNEGTFILEKKDVRTRNLIKQEILEKKRENEKFYKEILTNGDAQESQNQLLKEDSETKIIYRHVLDKDNMIRELNKDKNELLTANEDIFKDEDGTQIFLLRQDDICLKLHSIDSSEEERNFSIDKCITVENTSEDVADFLPAIIFKSFKQHLSDFFNIITKLLPKHRTTPRKPVDVYFYMFLCCFTNFFVMLFGFSKFALQDSDQRYDDDERSILNFIEENKVPSSLLVLLMIQFMIIIIDRIIYVRKNMLAKIIFHFIIILTTHIWLFFILPTATTKSFNSTLPPMIFYAIQFAYILISAYQIRSGYPKRISGNFLMKKYNLIHVTCFRIFLLIPFLFELRTLIDWTFTPTSLTLAEWVRVETIYNNAYDIKCRRYMYKDIPRGIKKSWISKALFGGVLIFVIIFIIWLPMLFYAYTHSLGESTVPKIFSMEVKIKNVEPIYQIKLRADNMHRFNAEEIKIIKHIYAKNPQATSFLSDFNEGDITLLQMSVSSSSVWKISPPSLNKLLSDFEGKENENINFFYEISQIGYLKDKQAILKFEHKFTKDEKLIMVDVLKRNSTIILKNIFPKFLYVANTGKVNVVRKIHRLDKHFLRNLKISLIEGKNEWGMTDLWWNIEEICEDELYTKILKPLEIHDCKKYINFFIFNEKTFPSQLSRMAVTGILGLYVSTVVLVSRFIRNTVISSGNIAIIIEELPNVDKILHLCKNIYMVREAQEFTLEEDLVAKLLFLFRSPETLIKITRHKEL